MIWRTRCFCYDTGNQTAGGASNPKEHRGGGLMAAMISDGRRTITQDTPGRGCRFPHRAAWRLAYGAFLLILLSGLEGVSRWYAARSGDPVCRMILYDYGCLVRRDASRFRFVPDPVLSYRLKPGYEFHSPDGHGVTRHNAQGFRADAPFPQKTPETLRIICLGGSTTYGVSVVDNASTYPAVLDRLLNGDLPPDGWDRVEVFNLGVGGYTSREVLLTLREHGLPLAPDVVLIQCAVNDVTPRFYPNFDPQYRHFRKPLRPLNTGFLARLAFRSRLVLLTGWKLGLIQPLTLQARTQHPMPTVAEAENNLARNGPDAFRNNLAEAIALARDSGAQVWLLTEAHLFGPAFSAPDEEARRMDDLYRRGLGEHNAVVRDLARNLGVGLVDLEERMPPSLRYFSDPVHMTEAGNLVKARIIAESIRESLTAPNPRTQGPGHD